MHEGSEQFRDFFGEEIAASRAAPWLHLPTPSCTPVSLEAGDEPQAEPAPGWKELLQEAVGRMATVVARRREEQLQIEGLARDVDELKEKVQAISQATSVIVPVASLAPEPFDLLKEVKVVVQPSGDEYLASFFDANVNASGCTQNEAVNNLKDVMIGLFKYLDSQPTARLGRRLVKQLEVLRTFIRRRE
jgi:hypothetical protein